MSKGWLAWNPLVCRGIWIVLLVVASFVRSWVIVVIVLGSRTLVEYVRLSSGYPAGEGEGKSSRPHAKGSSAIILPIASKLFSQPLQQVFQLAVQLAISFVESLVLPIGADTISEARLLSPQVLLALRQPLSLR